MRTPRNYFAGLTVLALAAGMCAAAAVPRLPGQTDAKKKPAAPAAGIIASDKGKFRLALDGQVVGSEEFEISSSGNTWTARGSTMMHVPGGTDVKAQGQLKMKADGTPVQYQWSAQAAKKASGMVDFVNGMAHASINLDGASPFIQDFTFPTPRVALLDNNLYYQYAVLAQLYDWQSGGKQTFPVLIPQEMIPGSISVESLGPQQEKSAKYEALRVSSQDLEILLYLDAGHHLARLEVPASKVIIQRE
jgi:hypothetical protein